MTSYYSADVWDTTVKLPSTCKKAWPIEYEQAQNCEVAYIVGAKYRNTVLTGHFALSPFEDITKLGMYGKVVVLCRWFDHRLADTGLTFQIDTSNCQHVPGYTGDIVKNISN